MRSCIRSSCDSGQTGFPQAADSASLRSPKPACYMTIGLSSCRRDDHELPGMHQWVRGDQCEEITHGRAKAAQRFWCFVVQIRFRVRFPDGERCFSNLVE